MIATSGWPSPARGLEVHLDDVAIGEVAALDELEAHGRDEAGLRVVEGGVVVSFAWSR
jgi:hypothetical protein